MSGGIRDFDDQSALGKLPGDGIPGEIGKEEPFGQASAIQTPIAQLPVEPKTDAVRGLVMDDEFGSFNLDAEQVALMQSKDAVVLSNDDEFGGLDLSPEAAALEDVQKNVVSAKKIEVVELRILLPAEEHAEAQHEEAQQAEEQPGAPQSALPISPQSGMDVQNGLLAAHIQRHVEVHSPPPRHQPEGAPGQLPSVPQRPQAEFVAEPGLAIKKPQDSFLSKAFATDIAHVLNAEITEVNDIVNEELLADLEAGLVTAHHVVEGEVALHELHGKPVSYMEGLMYFNKSKGYVALHHAQAATPQHIAYIQNVLRPARILVLNDQMFSVFSVRLAKIIDTMIQKQNQEKEDRQQKVGTGPTPYTAVEKEPDTAQKKVEKEPKAMPAEVMSVKDEATLKFEALMEKEKEKALEKLEEEQQKEKELILEDSIEYGIKQGEIRNQDTKDAALHSDIQRKEEGLAGSIEERTGKKKKS